MTLPLLDLTTDRKVHRSFSFPDGQPHIAVRAPGGPIRLAARIASSDDLVRLLQVQNILQSKRPRDVFLTLGYVMGGRMDRAMPLDEKNRVQPFTLKIVADCIKTAGFAHISVFDPHSEVTPALLDAKTILPIEQVRLALQTLPKNTALVAPDAGAAKRVEMIGKAVNRPVVYCTKKRDPGTGQLSGFKVATWNLQREGNAAYLIVDDICDGGRTFTGVAQVLRAHENKPVHLYVSHGIFSKKESPFRIDDIDTIFTTNSYQTLSANFLHRPYGTFVVPDHVKVLPWLA